MTGTQWPDDGEDFKDDMDIMHSELNLMRRFREAIERDDELQEQIDRLKRQRAYWVNVRVDVRGRLAAMGINPYEVVEQEEATTPPAPVDKGD